MNISLLNFKQKQGCNGTHAVIFFDNGYGASVITGEFAYVSDSEPYELAVIKGKEEDWGITYLTPLTDDVIGHQAAEQIEKLLDDIAALPAA